MTFDYPVDMPHPVDIKVRTSTSFQATEAPEDAVRPGRRFRKGILFATLFSIPLWLAILGIIYFFGQ